MWEAEITIGSLVVLWILYELYGRTALDMLNQYTNWIRIGGGLLIFGYLYWQASEAPSEFRETLDLAKGLLTSSGIGGAGGTREKRNVTGLMKKKVAASQEWKCGHCKATLDETYEVDHIKALFNGGSNDQSNLVALCPHCHRKKTVEERLAT